MTITAESLAKQTLANLETRLEAVRGMAPRKRLAHAIALMNDATTCADQFTEGRARMNAIAGEAGSLTKGAAQ